MNLLNSYRHVKWEPDDLSGLTAWYDTSNPNGLLGSLLNNDVTLADVKGSYNFESNLRSGQPANATPDTTGNINGVTKVLEMDNTVTVINAPYGQTFGDTFNQPTNTVLNDWGFYWLVRSDDYRLSTTISFQTHQGALSYRNNDTTINTNPLTGLPLGPDDATGTNSIILQTSGNIIWDIRSAGFRDRKRMVINDAGITLEPNEQKVWILGCISEFTNDFRSMRFNGTELGNNDTGPDRLSPHPFLCEDPAIPHRYRINQASNQATSNDAKFTIGESIWFKGALTTNQHEKIEGYLAHKWGCSDLLPTNHVYKTFAPAIGN